MNSKKGWQQRTWTPTNFDTLPSSVLMGVMVSRFQNGVPSRLHARQNRASMDQSTWPDAPCTPNC